MAFNVTTISPEQQLQFQQGRSNAAANNLRGRAQTQYNQGLATQDYADRTRDFTEQANRARQDLPTSFIQRGVFNSGIYRDALRRYAIDRLSGQRSLQRKFQSDMAGLTFQGRGFEDEYAETLANLFGNQYAAQASMASALKGIM